MTALCFAPPALTSLGIVSAIGSSSVHTGANSSSIPASIRFEEEEELEFVVLLFVVVFPR